MEKMRRICDGMYNNSIASMNQNKHVTGEESTAAWESPTIRMLRRKTRGACHTMQAPSSKTKKPYAAYASPYAADGMDDVQIAAGVAQYKAKNKDNKEIKKGANEYDDVLGDDATTKRYCKAIYGVYGGRCSRCHFQRLGKTDEKNG